MPRAQISTASTWRAAAPGWGLMLALVVLTRAPFLGDPAADYDEQLYSLIGQHLLGGALPYHDLWDRKPPGLFLLFAAAHALGGAGPLAYQIPAMVLCAVGGGLLWRLARRLTDPATAGWVSALYPPLMALYGSHSGQSEIIFTPLLMAIADLVLITRVRRSLTTALLPLAGAMMIGGVALQIKYTVAPVCLWFGIAGLWVLREKGMRWWVLAACALAFAILGVLPTALAAAYFAWHGAFNDFVFANVLSIARRTPLPVAITLPRQIRDAAPLAMLVITGMVRASRPSMASWAWRFALGWLVAGIAGLFMGSTIYPYYYAALVPPVVLIALPLFDTTTRFGALTLAGMLAWLLIVLNPIGQCAAAWHDRQAIIGMARVLRPYINSTHELYVYDGPTALYALTDSPLPSRMIYPDHLNNQLEARALPVDPACEVRRILARELGAIVTSPQPVTLRNRATARLIDAELAAHYTLAGTSRLNDRPIALYTRRPVLAPEAKAGIVSKSSKFEGYPCR